MKERSIESISIGAVEFERDLTVGVEGEEFEGTLDDWEGLVSMGIYFRRGRRNIRPARQPGVKTYPRRAKMG